MKRLVTAVLAFALLTTTATTALADNTVEATSTVQCSGRIGEKTYSYGLANLDADGIDAAERRMFADLCRRWMRRDYGGEVLKDYSGHDVNRESDAIKALVIDGFSIGFDTKSP